VTGDRWFPELPADWKCERAKYVVQCLDRKINAAETDLEYTGLESVEAWTGRRVPSSDPAISEGTANVYSKGDVLFGKLRPYLAKALEVQDDGICSTEFLVLRPKKISGRYLQYLLRTPAFIDVISAWTYGAKMPRASWDIVGSLLLPIPPKGYMDSIVTFLDRETTRIDELVTEVERLSVLLEEKREAIVAHAVTKGLSTRVRMRYSGVEWLGDVPDHWEIRRVKTLFRLKCTPAPIDNDMELLSLYTDVGVKPRRELEERGNKASTTDGYWIVEPGDIVVNKLLAWMGAIAASKYGGVTSPAYDVLRAIKPLDPWYYDLLFRSGLYLTPFRMNSRGIMDMRLRLYFDRLGTILVPYPPKAEQQEIVKHVGLKTLPYTAAINHCKEYVSRLRHYRSSLVTDAVTGQIDVLSYRLGDPITV